MFTKTKLFTYLSITIKQCANKSVNYNYINKHYTYADSIYYYSVCIMSQLQVLFQQVRQLLMPGPRPGFGYATVKHDAYKTS